MLTRLRLRRDVRIFVRCLSDKNDKPPESNDTIANKADKVEQKVKKLDSNTDKIQELLKLMMAAPKISETQYRENFSTAPQRRKKSDEIDVKTEKIEESITKAAGEVAQAIGGDTKQTEAELLSKVLGKINQSSTSLSDLLIGMKVDRSKETDDVTIQQTRGQQVKRMVKRAKSEIPAKPPQRKTQTSIKSERQNRQVSEVTSIDIFSGAPLGLFKVQEPNYGTKLDLWQSLNQRELTLATSQPPANYFQKMIQWTEQGKVWKFPINNEQGLEEEENVHFSEHIFLDAHIEDWCPKRGPIRHFMELVCVGLSKNAFYTVQEKKDHIMWYKEYFESKKDVLTEIGAWDFSSGSEARV